MILYYFYRDGLYSCFQWSKSLHLYEAELLTTEAQNRSHTYHCSLPPQPGSVGHRQPPSHLPRLLLQSLADPLPAAQTECRPPKLHLQVPAMRGTTLSGVILTLSFCLIKCVHRLITYNTCGISYILRFSMTIYDQEFCLYLTRSLYPLDGFPI